MTQITYKPGETAKISGQGKIVGPRGGKTNNGEVTIVKNKTIPPTPKPHQKIASESSKACPHKEPRVE